MKYTIRLIFINILRRSRKCSAMKPNATNYNNIHELKIISICLYNCAFAYVFMFAYLPSLNYRNTVLEIIIFN